MLKHRLRLLLLMLLALLSSGCATVSPSSSQVREVDPWAKFNRGIFDINKVLDRVILKPVAEIYEAMVPEPLDIAITNFFSNLNDLVVIANDLFQFKFSQAGADSGRFLLNTAVGFFGFFDPATEYGLSKHYEDFGQTLGYWGVPDGPYLVLPLFGPSSLRDAPAMLVDRQFDPRRYIAADNTARRTILYGATALDVVDTRAGLLGAEKLLDTASIDDYAFMRDAYLQRRRAFIRDGEPSVTEAISDAELFGN